MEKFWLWMEEKGHSGSQRWLRKECAEKQMLIGYMIEYLFEQKCTLMEVPYAIQKMHDINILYNYLKERIEDIVGNVEIKNGLS